MKNFTIISASRPKGLKLHPVFQRVAADDPRVLHLCEEYAPYRLPLILCAVSLAENGREHIAALPRWNVCRAFLRIFNSDYFYSARLLNSIWQVTLAKRYENLYLELSGQPAQHIQHALAAIGSERLLFGSDWPFWRQTLPLQALRQAVQHDSTAEVRILWENASNLLGMEAN